ncbi:BREX-1 system adenine-specific DNA-methyltransferase PglX [Methanolobus chelungpuianus]|nr:BREX-1 system adenine-specific DNA-methyltransferase PglX [Methanolobus chelungpuianus]
MTNNTPSTTPVPNFYRASAADFKKIPGSPIAYWLSDRFRMLFYNSDIFESHFDIKAGMCTGKNEVFILSWFEISFDLIRNNDAETYVYTPHNKGGEFRKWMGNWDSVLKYSRKHLKDMEKNPGFRHDGRDYYFRAHIGWSKVTSSKSSFRYYPEGFSFDSAGLALFSNSEERLLEAMGFLNSKVAANLIQVLNPTLNVTPQIVKKMPLTSVNFGNIYGALCQHSKSDWNSYETSWDFTTLPLLQPEYHHPTLRETYIKLRAHWKEMTLEMQQLEEENNCIFIEAYGLQDELTPEVPLSEITLTCNPYYRYNGDRNEEELEALLLTDTIKEFISYAAGCMFGRYSLDKPGLVLANQGDKIGDYLEQVPEPSFMPDADNIIPILEDEYFEDDIIGRFKEFLKVTFGEDTLSENLDFIAEALGGNGKKSSEAVIRDYFLKSFYKDHLKMYKKRPIYWLFSSGKGRAFNALVYMHRYNKETLALMRTDYLLELEGKLDAKREMIKSDIGKDAQEKARLGKMIEELMAYDEVLKNKADEYIEIDLDDGVVVNYARFEGLVEKI